MQKIEIAPGIALSRLVYGMWRLGDDEVTSAAHVQAKVEACLAQGITTMDQADIYGGYTAEALLGEGGVLAVVSFHSLEDRIVKHFLRTASGAGRAISRHLPGEIAGPPPVFTQVSKGIRPSDAELDRNPRARSSTLRHAIRTGAPARSHAA